MRSLIHHSSQYLPEYVWVYHFQKRFRDALRLDYYIYLQINETVKYDGIGFDSKLKAKEIFLLLHSMVCQLISFYFTNWAKVTTYIVIFKMIRY